VKRDTATRFITDPTGAAGRRRFWVAATTCSLALVGCEQRAPGTQSQQPDVLSTRDSRHLVDATAGAMRDSDDAESSRPAPEHPHDAIVDPTRWPADLYASGRRPTNVQLRAGWSYVASMDDTTLLQPYDVAVLRNVVVAQDAGRMALLGLRHNNGFPTWRTGRRGSGPGEFQLGAILWASDTSILYSDVRLRRLTEWSDEGKLIASRELPKIGMIWGVCRLPDGNNYVMVRPHGADNFTGIARLPDNADSLLDRQPFPIKRAVHRSGLDAQMRLYQLADGSCALGASNESYLAVFHRVDSMVSVPLIEHVPPPVVEESKDGKAIRIGFAEGTLSAVRGVSSLGDMVAILYGGRTTARRRIVDLYHRAPWRYEGSFVMQGTVRSLSSRDSTLVVVSEDSTGFDRIDQFIVKLPGDQCCLQEH